MITAEATRKYEDLVESYVRENELSRRALVSARYWHRDQLRDDGKTPYIVHPIRVAGRIIEAYDVFDSQVAVALLHDIREDTAIPEGEIWAMGPDMFRGVWWLTSPDKEGVPGVAQQCRMKDGLGREARKFMQREKLCYAPRWVQDVKIADRLDNVLDLDPSMRGFYHSVYRDESKRLLAALSENPISEIELQLQKLLDDDSYAGGIP